MLFAYSASFQIILRRLSRQMIGTNLFVLLTLVQLIIIFGLNYNLKFLSILGTTSNRKTFSKHYSSTESLFNERLKDLGEPLLDFKLINRTIYEWSRPLPGMI